MPMTGAEVRRKFTEYFASKGHTVVRSSPLVPANDPTLLFVNAGMVQFKNVFTGSEQRPYKTAVSSQKCLRVSGKHNDLETVGRTARHHTFFEMLGNFSFGDYFKDDAISYGWQFLTEVVGLPADKLHVSVYTDDDEAALIWEKKIGLPASRIVRLGEKDNFWSMGDTGPCGPCSEIHVDRGEKYGCDNPGCGVGCDCDRYMEIWNLVFMQYDRDKDGNMMPLPNPSIDTGMGLERLVSVIQETDTNFDTDLILPVIRHMERLTDIDYRKDPKADVSFRVIGDHARAATFLIADNVHPSNEGRGYVLRRILRRALRHGKMLGVEEPFAYKLTETVVEIMKDAYPELADYASIIRGVVFAEEESFSATLENGMRLIGEMIDAEKKNGGDKISGAHAFKLYDTYGFPMDLAREIVEDAGMTMDMAGFEEEMNTQREMARKSWKGGSAEAIDPVYSDAAKSFPATDFVGYETESVNTKIYAIIKDGKQVNEVSAGDTAEVMLAATPFYAESGGQASDHGVISSESFMARVEDVKKPDGTHWFHTVRVDTGVIKTGDMATVTIDKKRRMSIKRNHSATHLLHAALREVLGAHVKQGGSLVDAGRLRFDYTYFTAPGKSEVERVERLVNEKIMENLAIATEEKSIEEATSAGATALFGEKYGESVRVVTMGSFSMELCGGTHANATGDIGLFRIVSEGGISAGVRRIEAVTGVGALDYVHEKDDVLLALGDKLKTPTVADIPDKTDKLLTQLRDLEKENKKLKEKLFAGGGGGGNGNRAVDVAGLQVVIQNLDGADSESMRTFVDDQKNRLGSGVVVAGAKQGEKALLAVGVTKDLTAKIQAGKIIKEVAGIVGGGGGGRPDFAQAGGKNPEKLQEALDSVPDIIKKLIG